MNISLGERLRHFFDGGVSLLFFLGCLDTNTGARRGRGLFRGLGRLLLGLLLLVVRHLLSIELDLARLVEVGFHFASVGEGRADGHPRLGWRRRARPRVLRAMVRCGEPTPMKPPIITVAPSGTSEAAAAGESAVLMPRQPARAEARRRAPWHRRIRRRAPP